MTLHEAALPGMLLLTAAAIVGVVVLVRSRHVVSAALVAVGIVAVAMPGSIVAWDRSPLTNSTSIHVDGLAPAADAGLTVEIVHHHISDDGIEYLFVARGGPEHVAAVFAEQHPGGFVTTAEPALVSAGGHSIWHVASDNVRFDLVAATASDEYELVSQVVVVRPEDGGPTQRIPFPRSALGASDIDEGQVYADGWTQAQWADFYEGISEVTVDGNSVTVPTDNGATATITLSAGISKVALND